MPDIITSLTNRENQVHALYINNEHIPGAETFICATIFSQFHELSRSKEIDLIHRPSTIITLGRRTTNDLTEWSDAVEEDDTYSLLRFSVEDLSCCKVIEHSGFGKKLFVT